MTKRKAKIEPKWAQLSPVERAYRKVRDADVGGFTCIGRTPKLETVEHKRKRNRYYQLLGHWSRLKKSNETLSPTSEG